MKRIAPIALAVAVLVGGVWWWTHRGTSGAPTGSPVTRPDDRSHPPGTRPDRPDPAAGAMPSLVDDDPAGSLRLEGQVLGAQNAPVEGALVVLASTPPRTVTTEADGSFAFTGLVGRSYRLQARHQSRVAGPVTVRVTASKQEPVILHLRVGASLEVVTVGSNGKPIDGATVELRGLDQERLVTASGSATFAPVVPGPYQIAAWADGMAHVYQTLRVQGQTRTKIMLVAGAAVSGTVVDADGKPVANARVLYASSSDVRGQLDPRLDAATSDATGAFAFAALPAGSVRFTATHPDYAPGTSALTTLDGTSAKSGVVVKLAPGATIKGRVVDTGKQPVAGARVQIAQGGRRRDRGGPPGPRADGNHQAYTNDNGEFEIKGLPRTELVANASHELGSAKPLQLDASAGDVRDVELVLDLTAIIAGTVVDPEGNPVEGAQVTAQPHRDEGGPPRGGRNSNNQDVTDSSGKFKITGLAEGSYALHASRSAMPSFGRRDRNGGGDGTDAKTGDSQVKLVLPAEGGVKGKVALEKGGVPDMFTVSVGASQQSFLGDGAFELGDLAPGAYTLQIRGPSFDTRQQDVTIESNKIVDLGTLQLVAGRTVGGIVVANNAPIGGATVYAGRQVMGNGTTNDSPTGGQGFGGGAKSTTTNDDGSFSLAGFGDGDLTIVADLPSVGRSKAMRVTQDQADQSALVVELLPYGALSGAIHQGVGQPATAVTCQSTTTPGAVNVVTAGADGAFRFDHLAPDTYKVSATLGSIRRGLHLYSQQVDVPSGKEVTVELTVEPGTVTLDAMPTSSKPTGLAIGYLASKPITATTAQGVSLAMAGLGAGTSQVAIARPGEPAEFDLVTPGAYTVCLVALPQEVGQGAQPYLDAHAGSLAAVCQPVTVAATPATQSVNLAVVVPPMAAGSGSGK